VSSGGLYRDIVRCSGRCVSTNNGVIGLGRSNGKGINMDPDKYQQLAGRTECNQQVSLKVIRDESLMSVRLSHAALGMAGEAGKLGATVERWLYYRQPLDVTSIREELGDCLWYIALACNALGCNLSEIMETNIAKLHYRYPYDDRYARETTTIQGVNPKEQLQGEQLQGDQGVNPKDQLQRVNPKDQQETTRDYPSHCKRCHIVVVHKNDTTGLCPDCAAELRANQRTTRGRTMS